MTTRHRLLESIAECIGDYRRGEIPQPTPGHVEKWVNQFASESRDKILSGVDYILRKSYIRETNMLRYLSDIAGSSLNMQVATPEQFWTTCHILQIQSSGQSQNMLNSMLLTTLKEKYRRTGLGGYNSCAYVYLDDASYSGNRIKSDICGWLRSFNPGDTVVLWVITFASHTSGKHYAETAIRKVGSELGLRLWVYWQEYLEIEDRKSQMNVSDVFRPRRIPDNPRVNTYVENMEFPPVLRTGRSVGKNQFFSSAQRRDFLEQAFLTMGVHIRNECNNLGQYQRPLGYARLCTLGFGATFVTWRNCSNNCPLVFWVSDPWYPLLPRRTN